MVYPDGLRLLEWEEKFKAPVLPVTKSVTVEFVMDENIPGYPDGEEIFPLQNAVHIKRNGCDMRFYLAENPKRVTAFSVYDGERVTVHTDAALGADFAFMFRPWHYMHLEDILLLNNALILHSASIIYKGGAIAFSAPSGTGKTTQTNLWHKYREGVKDLNGDKTLIQKTDKGFLACGFPIFGGSMRFEQEAVPLHSVIVVRRGEKDGIRRLNDLEKITALYSESTVFSLYRENVERAFDFLEDFIKSVNVVELTCTMNESAVDVLEEELFGTL